MAALIKAAANHAPAIARTQSCLSTLATVLALKPMTPATHAMENTHGATAGMGPQVNGLSHGKVSRQKTANGDMKRFNAKIEPLRPTSQTRIFTAKALPSGDCQDGWKANCPLYAKKF